MERFKISGVPVVDDGGLLVGIITNRDLRFETRFDIPVSEMMTPQPLVTVPVGTTLDEAKVKLQKHRIEKLLVVDENGHLKGLITVKDIQKAINFPIAAKDELGRLRCAAAIGATGDFLERAAALVESRVDAIVIDTAHGHSSRVINAVEAGQSASFLEYRADRRKRRDGRSDESTYRRRRRRGKDRHRPGLDLHDARRDRSGCSADHGDQSNASKRPRAQAFRSSPTAA